MCRGASESFKHLGGLEQRSQSPHLFTQHLLQEMLKSAIGIWQHEELTGDCFWSTTYYPLLTVPTRVIGCSKKLSKNATSPGQPTGSIKVSQPCRGRCHTQSRAGGSSAKPWAASLKGRAQGAHWAAASAPHPALSKQWGLAKNTMWYILSSLRTIYSSVMIISILWTGVSLLAAGNEQGQKAPCLHQLLCHL